MVRETKLEGMVRAAEWYGSYELGNGTSCEAEGTVRAVGRELCTQENLLVRRTFGMGSTLTALS